MTPDDAFMQTICENPEDDFPRLRYADYLEEQGQIERAEFIRVQCELEAWKNDSAEKSLSPEGIIRHGELKRCERKLLSDDNRTGWFAVPHLSVQLEGDATKLFWWIQPSGPRIEARISRGFVSKVIMAAEDWLLHADALTAATPLQEVTLTTELDWYAANYFFLTDSPSNREIKRKCILRFGGHWGSGPPVIQRIFDKEWPKIKFTLPDQGR